MDDFPGLFAKDFGIKPQGKAAPMAPPRSSGAGGVGIPGFGPRPDFGLSASANSKFASPIFDDHDRDGLLFNDVFGGPPKYSAESRASNVSSSSFDYDSIFKDDKPKYSSMPAKDKPVYDDDIFDGLPGVRSSSASSTAKYDDVFASMSLPPQTKNKVLNSTPFDDLLGNLGRKEAEVKSQSQKVPKDASEFDDLIPGFGARSTSESHQSQKSFLNPTKAAFNTMEDPFVELGSKPTAATSSTRAFTDPFEEISELNGSPKTRMQNPPSSWVDDTDPLEGLGKSVPTVTSKSSNRGKDGSAIRTGSMSGGQSPKEQGDEDNEIFIKKRVPSSEEFSEFHETMYDMPNVSTNLRQPVGQTSSPPLYKASSSNGSSSHVNSNQGSAENSESFEDIWLTVSEIPLFTEPTSAPPPSRPPPPRPPRVAHGPSYPPSSVRSSVTSPVDELEGFALGRTQNNVNDHSEAFPGEDFDTNSVAAASAAAMKEAMDRAESKFRHAKEMRERENLKSCRNKDHLDKDEKPMQDAYDRELRERRERLVQERQLREKEEEEREQLRRKVDKEREEKAREQRRLEKERERARELERDREKARQAVERATREARERAAAEARARAEKAAVEKAAAEARERAERAAVQRAHAEARERAAAEARERAEKAAAEVREREAREKTKAEADARLRAEQAAAEARERATEAARANQQTGDNDLETIFGMGRASSAPKDPFFDTQKVVPEATRGTSVGSSSSMRKASSTANIVDDLTSIFGAATSSAGEFQDIEGESEERRRARMERHQRTQERAAKALAEKNQRDMEAQREQAERHRIAETLDFEIKRWAAGKEGNLRALLSTLQYVLWPECGWQPVSLTDLITAAAVKKVYRKATLCIHPDKVQQKGANLQQKYIAEKVFDVLKEAWNKFNSEELF